ncbi:MAG: hypothetical protein RDU25_03050 [Patescibacteria group bacterium]|nr:hypothetical protein [Patescibacteria group bacterium]
MIKEPFSPFIPSPETPVQGLPLHEGLKISEEDKKLETGHVELFIQHHLAETDLLNEEQKAAVVAYVKSHNGTWLHYDDDGVYVHDFQVDVEGNKVIFTFCVVEELPDGSKFGNACDSVIELP